MSNPLQNRLFQSLEPGDLSHLNRTVARPIPLWSFMTIENHAGRKITIPVASMLAVVSSYDTVLAITDAVVPIIKRDSSGHGKKLQRHFRYVAGKPAPTITERRSPLAFLNHEFLHRILLQHDATARKLLRQGSLPKELRDMVAGFRLIRAYRQRHATKEDMMVQRWDVYKIDETIVKDTVPGKAPLIDPQDALTLDYSLQCPPCFEMLPRGFTSLLMQDLGAFMGREPFQAETTTAYKYRLWKASETAEQFNLMFQIEEEQRREAIIMQGGNISAMPIRKVFTGNDSKAPKGKSLRPKSSDRGNARGGASVKTAPPVITEYPAAGWGEDFTTSEIPDWDFGIDNAEISELQASIAPVATVEDSMLASSPSGFGLAGMSAHEQDTLLKSHEEADTPDTPAAPPCIW